MIRYKGGYKYQLAEDCTIQVGVRPDEMIETRYLFLFPDGRLHITAGYAWDGPSGPTFDTWFPRLYRTFMRGSLAHDAIYQLLRMELLDPMWRVMADQDLERICREDGMCRIRGRWVYLGVRVGAGFAASKKHARELLTAP